MWDRIYSYKDTYSRKAGSPSWNSYIGKVFQRFVYFFLKNYISELTKQKRFRNIILCKEGEIKNNPILKDKLSIEYGQKESALPDIDMVVAKYDFSNPKEAKIVAIISCKTSLRERIAQACYWKIKLAQNPSMRHIKVYLVTSDNDKDFDLDEEGKKSRDRIIAEHELDGIYILKGDFNTEWESNKVKYYGKIFNDLKNLLNNRK